MKQKLSVAVTVLCAIGATLAFMAGHSETGMALLAAAGGTGFLPQAVGK